MLFAIAGYALAHRGNERFAAHEAGCARKRSGENKRRRHRTPEFCRDPSRLHLEDTHAIHIDARFEKTRVDECNRLAVKLCGGRCKETIVHRDRSPGARHNRGRADRLVGDDLDHLRELHLCADTSLVRIVEEIRRVKPTLVILDSIQMVHRADLDAPPGSTTQLRRCCHDLVQAAKISGAAIVIVGHVTKEGQLAGPKLLEHLVDAVLAFEGDRDHGHRVLRAAKNRFGSTQEIGLFEMTDGGQWKVDSAVLGALDDPLAEAVLRGKAAGKAAANWVQPFLDHAAVDGRAHTRIRTLGARSGRMSATDPNLLNVPTNDWRIRRCLIADEHQAIVAVDFHQVEPRVMAYLADERQAAAGHVSLLLRMIAEWVTGTFRMFGLIDPNTALGFSVGVFTSCAIACIISLTLRRAAFGAELGGQLRWPPSPSSSGCGCCTSRCR